MATSSFRPDRFDKRYEFRSGVPYSRRTGCVLTLRSRGRYDFYRLIDNDGRPHDVSPGAIATEWSSGFYQLGDGWWEELSFRPEWWAYRFDNAKREVWQVAFPHTPRPKPRLIKPIRNYYHLYEGDRKVKVPVEDIFPQ